MAEGTEDDASEATRLSFSGRYAMTDSLTELLNRRAFDTSLAAELTRGQGGDAGLSMLLIDVDRFKQVNDALGHAAGDRVLEALAR